MMNGPYARISVLTPHDGDTIDFEAGYVRHLGWHHRANDPWSWFGWTVWAGDRQRWFVYATFGHTAAELDHPISPLEDERDSVANVTPHAQFTGSALYEFLPSVSRGTATPASWIVTTRPCSWSGVGHGAWAVRVHDLAPWDTHTSPIERFHFAKGSFGNSRSNSTPRVRRNSSRSCKGMKEGSWAVSSDFDSV